MTINSSNSGKQLAYDPLSWSLTYIFAYRYKEDGVII